MSELSLSEALQVALDFEERGRVFYTRAAAQALDPLSKKLFAVLAEDEVLHAAKVQELFSSIARQEPVVVPAPIQRHELETEIRAFFESHRQSLSPQADNLAGYEFAITMEKQGIEMYRRSAQASGQAAEQEFFQALEKEERGHLAALQNVYFFMTQPGDWLEEDESQRWNWMNL